MGGKHALPVHTGNSSRSTFQDYENLTRSYFDELSTNGSVSFRYKTLKVDLTSMSRR